MFSFCVFSEFCIIEHFNYIDRERGRGRNTDFVLICSVMFLSEQVSALLRSLCWVQRDSHINVIICSVTIIVPQITAAFQSVTHIWVMTVQPRHLKNCTNIIILFLYYTTIVHSSQQNIKRHTINLIMLYIQSPRPLRIWFPQKKKQQQKTIQPYLNVRL